MLLVWSASARRWFPGAVGFLHVRRVDEAALLGILHHRLPYLIDHRLPPLPLLHTAVHRRAWRVPSHSRIGVVAIACDTAWIVLRIAGPRGYGYVLILAGEVELDQLAAFALG